MLRLLLLLYLMLAGSASAAPISVTDDLGNVVVLDEPADSVISLAPHLTEMMYSLGAGDKMLATVRYSDYPEAAKELPVLGDAFSLSLEAVVERSPDLILAWSTGGNQQTVARLQSLGFKVYINEAKTLDDIASNLERIGELVGRQQTGASLAAEFRDELAVLRKDSRGSGKRVFFQISDAQLYTVNNEHLIGEAISMCGAENIFGDLTIPVPMVSFESVVAADPEIILVASPHNEFVSRWNDEWQDLGWMPRVRSINASLITRPSFKMLKGVKTLCEQL